MSFQSFEQSKSLAQLLALNAMFDAARLGAAGRQSAQLIESAVEVMSTAAAEPAGDAFFNDCYAALMDGSGRPAQLL